MWADITDFQLAWAIGIIEGEGTFVAYEDGHHRYGQTRIVVCMNDQDVIERLREWTKVGSISVQHPPSWKKLNRKLQYRWNVAARKEVRWLLDLIFPHLGTRRQGQASKLDAMLKLYEAEE